MPELKLALEQAEVCGVLQGLSQAWLPPAELLLPAGQLQEVALLQVGPTLCWGSRHTCRLSGLTQSISTRTVWVHTALGRGPIHLWNQLGHPDHRDTDGDELTDVFWIQFLILNTLNGPT